MKRTQIFVVAIAILALMMVLARERNGAIIGIGLYAGFAICYLLMKLLASSWYRPDLGPAPDGIKVAAIIPVHDEEPDAFEVCLSALLAQTRPLDEIWVIDDGSKSNTCNEVAVAMLGPLPNTHVIVCNANRGKRQAQAEAIRRSQAHVFLMSDSDTVFAPDAVAEGLRPFADPHVQAVAGNVRARNHSENLLTRLVDLMYQSAMERERAAQTVFDSVLVASGALSFYRADVVRANLGAYLSQTFLGAPVKAGDDARLTNYALQRGRVVAQTTAKAYTDIPATLRAFLRQQVRWNRSFFREALYALWYLSPRRPVWWLRLVDTTLWLAFPIAILVMLTIAPWAGSKLLSFYYLAYVVMAGYLHRLSFAITRWDRYLMSPVYSLIHILLLVPLRFYALATIRDSAWMTRAR